MVALLMTDSRIVAFVLAFAMAGFVGSVMKSCEAHAHVRTSDDYAPGKLPFWMPRANRPVAIRIHGGRQWCLYPIGIEVRCPYKY